MDGQCNLYNLLVVDLWRSLVTGFPTFWKECKYFSSIVSPVCGLQTLLKKLKMKKLFNRLLLKWWIRLLEIFVLFHTNTYCLGIADFIEDEIEGAVEYCSRDFLYIESFLTLSPDNSCEDLFQCCFYFPMTPLLVSCALF